MTAVRGRDINLYVEKVNSSGIYVFSACATNLSMEVTAEEINITTADSGIENEYEGGSTDCTISMDGVVSIDDLSKAMYEDWRSWIGTKKNIRVDFTNSYGDRLRYQMSMLITSVGADGDANDFGMYHLGGKRSGPEAVSKGYDHILVDIDLDPILDTDGDLIRTP
jgi:hypothetical protein